MFRISYSRRAALLKLACFTFSLLVLAGIIVSVHSGHHLAFLAAQLAVVLATVSGVEAYWAGVAARRFEHR